MQRLASPAYERLDLQPAARFVVRPRRARLARTPPVLLRTKLSREARVSNDRIKIRACFMTLSLATPRWRLCYLFVAIHVFPFSRYHRI